MCGNYINTTAFKPKSVWRVSPDGALQDRFKVLTTIFDMDIEHFFNHYSTDKIGNDSYLMLCKEALAGVRSQIPELPFSNIWLASQLAPKLPEDIVIHFSRSHTYRSWSFFDLPKSSKSISNVGGCGIDGSISSLIGASLVDTEKLYYLFIGDLAFFYDMNSLGNRHVGSNIRILLINNGVGTEFRNYGHPVAGFGEDANAYVAAGGHNGNKSTELVKHYAQSLGFEYLSASSKDDYMAVYERFVTSEITDRPMIFEIFTTSNEESEALKLIRNITPPPAEGLGGMVKKGIKSIVGDDGIKSLKRIKSKITK